MFKNGSDKKSNGVQKSGLLKKGSLQKNSLLGRLRIRNIKDDQPPTPFEVRIRWVKRCLTVAIMLAVAMLVAFCLAPIEDVYTATGIVRPGEYRRLYASTDLEQRAKPAVHEGDEVKKGDVLMTFRLPELEQKILGTEEELRNTSAELLLQQAKTRVLKKNPLPKELWEINEQVAKGKFNRDYYQAQLERVEELAKSGDISKKDADRARLEYEQAKIEHQRVKQRFEMINTGYTDTLMDEARAAENKIAIKLDNLRERLEMMNSELVRLTVIKAPEDGRILDMPQKNVVGIIKAGQELVYMLVGDTRLIEIFGLQQNFDKVSCGQKVRYKSEVFNSLKFGYAEGRVTNISQIRSSQTGDSRTGMGERYYSIIATIDKQPKELKLDSNVTAQIILREDRLIKVLFGRD